MKKQDKSKETFRKKFWKFKDKHPRIDRFFSKLSDVLDKFMILYFIFATILIVIPIICLYCALPEEIRTGTSVIAGSIMSLIVIPLFIDAINRKKESQNKRFETNKDLYIELSDILIQLQSQNKINKNTEEKFRTFIVSNYKHMCVHFSSSLIYEIYRTYRAYTNNQTENIKFYSEKCMKYIRRESGNSDDFMYSSMIFELMEQNKD